jgi:hypothetical protein
MAKQAKLPVKRTSTSLRNTLLLIPALAFLIKLSIIARIQGFDWYTAGNGDMSAGLKTLLDKNYAPAHVWYGADAESYLRAVQGLFRDGIFSTEGTLSYWPAGYPLLIWLVGLIAQGGMLMLVAIFQSILYLLACAFFVDEIRQSRLTNFAFPVALVLAFNPTLALNSIAIGYESPTSALVLLSTAALMRYTRLKSKRLMNTNLIIAFTCFAIATFMQPRLFILGLIFFILWGISQSPLRSTSLITLVSMLIISIGPAIMVARNSKSMGFAAISTNLGVTMNIGAGDKATGGYSSGKNYGVACPEAVGNAAQVDSAKVRCVIRWYLNNPPKALRLFLNKAIYFWSPWYGPNANGTMARNPWREIHPLNETVKTQSGAEMVYGNTGKLISWLWVLSGIFFLFWGFRFLWQAGGLERLWGTAAFTLVVINWLSSIATIGDHRFRIPTMTLSLALQVIGFTSIFVNKRKRLVGAGTDVSWPGLHWKRKSETDNLQP